MFQFKNLGTTINNVEIKSRIIWEMCVLQKNNYWVTILCVKVVFFHTAGLMKGVKVFSEENVWTGNFFNNQYLLTLPSR